MPGLKKSPGMADIDVCYGAHKAGTEGVQSAIQKARWTFEQSRLQDVGALDQNRYSVISSPEEGPDAVAQIDDGPPSPLSEHELLNNGDLPSPEENGAIEQQQANGVASATEFDNVARSPTDDHEPTATSAQDGISDVVPSPPRINPIDSFGSEESRLPPTPPTMENSDDAENRRNEVPNPRPALPENVLLSKQSGPNMTPVNQPASPPTPDPSPPRNQQSTPTPNMRQAQNTQLLSLKSNRTFNERTLRDGASSVAESFRTAQEDYNLESNTKMSPVHLPEDDKLPTHWLDSTRELQSASINLRDVAVEQTPKIEEAADPRRSASEKYPSGHRHKGLGIVSDGEKGRAVSQQAEERNNAVYKRLRDENVMRHSAVSAGSGAITVGISIPSPELTPRTLRRQNKRSSLRVSSTPDSNRDLSPALQSTPPSSATVRDRGLGIDSGRTLKVRKAREVDKNSVLTSSPLFGKSTLEDSPVLESSIRQVSSPAKLGPDASDMTALTYASLQDSPSANKRLSKFQSDPPHKLRHLSYEDRLSRNMSVRRTSLEASPPLNNALFRSKAPPQAKTRQLPAEESKVPNNIAVKRTRPAETKTPQRPEQPRAALPNLDTSPRTASVERSPGGTLRHFPREERLENNSSVRRTSLEQPPQIPFQAEPGATPRGSIDKSVRTFSPQSPRKSMDARYLHPTTTPMSISQFSDRTENIEIGEANGVQFYPHTNESLLVVQNLSRPASNDKDASEAPNFFPLPPEGISYRAKPTPFVAKPVFSARIEPPTPTLSTSKPAHQVDSPLINPRAAPEPPIFKVIPPTPERELDNRFDSHPPIGDYTRTSGERTPKQRLSLVQRARRYSDIMFPNLGSLRISRDRSSPEGRATHLSPTWRPQGFWDEFDSDGEDYDDFEPAGTLPRGGDTSDIPENEAQRKGILPRAMSKRLPGFRGTGGFLQGNSLGIDRHGTNNRRHYVSTGTRTLSKRQSEEVIRNMSQTAGRMSPDQRLVKQRRFMIPLVAKKFRARMSAVRLGKEEKEKEKRREKLRRSIGYRVYHDT